MGSGGTTFGGTSSGGTTSGAGGTTAGGTSGAGTAETGALWATSDAGTTCWAFQEVTLTLHNDSDTTVYLPGCGDYFIEQGTDHVPDVECEAEGIARPVPAHSTFDAPAKYWCPNASGSRTLCFRVGVECSTSGVALSQAQCVRLDWVCAPTFLLGPTP